MLHNLIQSIPFQNGFQLFIACIIGILFYDGVKTLWKSRNYAWCVLLVTVMVTAIYMMLPPPTVS